MNRSLTIAIAAIVAIGITPAIQAAETHHDYNHDSHDSDSHHTTNHRPTKKSSSHHYVPKKKVVYRSHKVVTPPHYNPAYAYPYGYGNSYYGNGYYGNSYYSNGYYGYYR